VFPLLILLAVYSKSINLGKNKRIISWSADCKYIDERSPNESRLSFPHAVDAAMLFSGLQLVNQETSPKIRSQTLGRSNPIVLMDDYENLDCRSSAKLKTKNKFTTTILF